MLNQPDIECINFAVKLYPPILPQSTYLIESIINVAILSQASIDNFHSIIWQFVGYSGFLFISSSIIGPVFTRLFPQSGIALLFAPLAGAAHVWHNRSDETKLDPRLIHLDYIVEVVLSGDFCIWVSNYPGKKQNSLGILSPELCLSDL